MKREKLLKDFLRAFPVSFHSLDTDRFLEYAIECILDGEYIDKDAMLDAGLSEKVVGEYQVAFEWIRDTYNYVMRNFDKLA